MTSMRTAHGVPEPGPEGPLVAIDTSPRLADRETPALRWGLLLAAFAFLLLRIGRPPVVYDEGLILAGADRILLGEVPFRDFWNTHPPGQIWILAGLFRLFGESMVVLRVYDAAVKAGLALALFAWAGRLAPRRGALVAFAAAILWLEFYGSFGFGYTAFPALLFGLASLGLVVARAGAARAPRARLWIAGAGLCAGLGALVRLDFGVYSAAVAGATIVASHAMRERPESVSRLREGAAAVALFGAGVLGPMVLAFVVLAAQGVTISRLVDVLVIYPTTVFPDYRALPLPGFTPWRLAYYIPVWFCLAGLSRGIWLACRRTGSGTEALSWCALSLLALISLPQALTRADMVHQAPVLLPSAAVASALWCWLWARGAAPRAIACLLVPVFALTYTAAPLYSWVRPASASAAFDHGLSRAAGVALEPDQAAAVREVQRRTRVSDSIYVGNTRHDRVLLNDALFYFLAGRRYATPYQNLLPGLATRVDVQREIVASLRANATGCLVLCTRFDRLAEPNASTSTSGSRLLDAYIRQAYTLSGTIGGYQLWTRR